jgi:hypothetical protein
MRTTRTHRRPVRTWAAALLGAVALALAACDDGAHGGTTAAGPSIPALPATLAETGLFADASMDRLGEGVLPFSPQYPLWTDGATKRRWIRLPPGGMIDGSDPDAWRFPVGTRLWKEFSFGRRVETRMIERVADGRWRFAAYVWSADGRTATLAPVEGVRRAHEIRSGVAHDVPGVQDCLACHGERADPVLGFSALQLSGDRDPLAPHGETPAPESLDLPALVERGLIESAHGIDVAPRIAARTERERAALGYLHANCGSCHAEHGPLRDLGLALDVRLADDGAANALETALGRPARYRPPGEREQAVRILAGHPQASVLFRRAASRAPAMQMPPLGTRTPDPEGLALLDAWIRELGLLPPPTPPPSLRTPEE